MKRIFLIQAFVFALVFSAGVSADDDWGHHHHHHHGWGHHHHHHHGWGGGYPRSQVNNYYYGQPPVAYFAPPPPPPVMYYPPQPQYRGGRSHQGLAGGVIGTVFGYELGNGDPLAAGLGAAAGSFLGNGVGWRY